MTVNGLSVPRSRFVRWMSIHLGIVSILFMFFACWQTEIIGQDLKAQLREYEKEMALLDKQHTKLQADVGALDARLRIMEAMNIGPTLATLQANSQNTTWLLRGTGFMLLVLIFEMLFRVSKSLSRKGQKNDSG